MISLRLAGPADLATVLPRTAALNAHEGITLEPAALEASLARLLAAPELGSVWLVERAGAPIGYAIVTYGYDLEFGGRDAFLTEIWIDEAARGGGAGGEVLDALALELRARGLHALHLGVRPENPARRLYARRGFVASPRIMMTRTL